MRITVLGCSGGIGGSARTTALLIDDDILIDAGTGLGDLSLPAMARIDHVFLTHSHLDHLACLPMMLDSVGADRDRPVTVHAQPATLDALRGHVFNNVIWPDFSRLPTPQHPFLVYQELPPGVPRTLDGRALRSVPVNHVVPAVGYLVSAAGGSLAFSGDTTMTEGFWRALNDCTDLRHVIIETSFLEAEAELARVSRHLSPGMLAGELAKLQRPAEVHITHLMPGQEEEIMAEIAARTPGRKVQRLRAGQVFEV